MLKKNQKKIVLLFSFFSSLGIEHMWLCAFLPVFLILNDSLQFCYGQDAKTRVIITVSIIYSASSEGCTFSSINAPHFSKERQCTFKDRKGKIIILYLFLHYTNANFFIHMFFHLQIQGHMRMESIFGEARNTFSSVGKLQ